MAPRNCTRVTGFIFRGITDILKLQNILFVFFFAIYFCMLVGNVWMIVLISVDSQLHSSMFFFLSNLSLLDVVSSSVIAPKVMLSSLVKSKDIYFSGCVVQFFLFSFCADELCLLAVTAYNRFVAICNPLLYNVIMSKRVCFQLVAGSYLCACANATVHTSTEFSLSFGHSNVLDHFFCDICPLQEIACSDFCINKRLLVFLFGSLIEVITIVTNLISYILIIVTMLRIRSTKGRRKAFYTCTSHLTAVSMFHGTILFMYLRPSANYSLDTDKMASVFYTMVIPMLNPLIYSLRNKDVKDSLRRAIETKLRAHFSPKGVRIGQPNPSKASLHT
ncbi:olfactory receptor-like protein COR4 [Mauremys reevesii]|uniref:olfactory receptor-like protein COR4 n=1 Tax=Mauremys reevesii TaxID=260615 RepID=UPI00194008EA|nr:olfactory receptor-like protein COR4 [Mauremys reevesii]